MVNPYAAATVDISLPVQPCTSGNYQGWFDLFYCINPNSWAFLGVGIALAFSTVGAAW